MRVNVIAGPAGTTGEEKECGSARREFCSHADSLAVGGE
jgi:hypothetical protein